MVDRDLESANYYRTADLLLNIGTDTLRKKLTSAITPSTFEDFLNINKHQIFHLWKPKQCCHCKSINRNYSVFRKDQWESVFKASTPCPVSGNTDDCWCSYVASPGITVAEVDISFVSCLLINIIHLSPCDKVYVEKIRKLRNEFVHKSPAKLPVTDFTNLWKDATHNIKELAQTCGMGFANQIKEDIKKLESAVLDKEWCNRILNIIQNSRHQLEGFKEVFEESQQNLAASIQSCVQKEGRRQSDLAQQEADRITAVVQNEGRKMESLATRVLEKIDELRADQNEMRKDIELSKNPLIVKSNEEIDLFQTEDLNASSYLAGTSGSVTLVKYFKDLGADLQMSSVIQSACFSGSLDLVKYLISHKKIDRETLAKELNGVCFSGKMELVECIVNEYPDLLDKLDDYGMSNLHYACEGGSVDVVKYLIIKGINVTHVANNKKTILHSACLSGNLELVRFLVTEYPDLLHMVNHNEMSTLHYACKHGSVDVVKYLVNNGLNVEDVDKNKRTNLHIACKNGHLELVRFLVNEYPDLLHMVDHNGMSNLHDACFGGSVDIVRYLISKGLDVTHLSKDKISILHSACYGGNLEMVKYIVDEYPDSLHKVTDSGKSNLHFACVGGSIDVVKYLIDTGLDVKQVTKDKESILHTASNGCHLELVRYLVNEYPDFLHMTDVREFSNLHYACDGGSVDVVKCLTDKGLDVKQVAKDKRTILHTACVRGHLELVRYLADKYPDLLNMVDVRELSNLHYACYGGSVDVVKYLTDKGLDVKQVSKEKITILHSACFKGNLEMVKYIADEYPDLLHMVDDSGKSNLHFACEVGSTDVVKYLIDKGMDVKQVTKDKESILHTASNGCHVKLVMYLVNEFPDLLM